MSVFEVIFSKPAAGFTVLVCLASTAWAAIVVSRLRRAADRFLVGLVGLLSVNLALQTLEDAGWTALPAAEHWRDVSMLVVAALYLLAIAVLQSHTTEYRNTEYRLRLAEANETHVSTPPQREAVRGHPDEEKVIRAFLHSSPLAIFVVDPGGSIQYWSGAAERLFGWSRAEISGQAPPFPIPSGDSNAVLPCRVHRKDGSPLELELHVAPLQDGSLGEADRLVVASVPVAAAGAKAPAIS